MFSEHFHNIFSSLTMAKSTLVARNSCFKVVPHKVSICDRDRLEKDFTKEYFFNVLNLMKNDRSPGIDGLPCEFYKTMWDIVGDDVLHMRCFLLVPSMNF